MPKILNLEDKIQNIILATQVLLSWSLQGSCSRCSCAFLQCFTVTVPHSGTKHSMVTVTVCYQFQASSSSSSTSRGIAAGLRTGCLNLPGK